MFEVTEEALSKIKKFLEEQEGNKPIRVVLTERGWRVPFLVMALDEEREGDEVFNMDGVTFLIGKELLERAKPIRIDYTHSTVGAGYKLESQFSREMADDGEASHCEIRESCQGL